MSERASLCLQSATRGCSARQEETAGSILIKFPGLVCRILSAMSAPMIVLPRRREISDQSASRTTSTSQSAIRTSPSMPIFSILFTFMAIIDPQDMSSPIEPSTLMAEIEFQPIFPSMRGVRKIQDVRYRCLCQVHDRPVLLHPCSIYLALVKLHTSTI